MKKAFLLICALTSVYSYCVNLTPKYQKPFKYIDENMHIVAEATGVELVPFLNFYRALNDGNPLSPLRSEMISRSQNCVSIFSDNKKSRSAFLQCLADQGPSGISESLFSDLYNLYIEKTLALGFGDTLDLNVQKSLHLLTFISDVVREHIYYEQVDRTWLPVYRNSPSPKYPAPPFSSTNWFAVDKNGGRFLDGKHEFHDFDYQDGDIYLSTSKTSISTLIPLITKPQRRFAHAAFVRVRDGKMNVLESVIGGFRSPGGVKKLSFEKFKKGHPRHMLILRLRKDIKKRDEIIQRASDLALTQVGMPYNISGDMTRTDSFFCSQLVAWAYSEAATQILGEEVTIEELVPGFAEFVSEEVYNNLLVDIGVKSKTIPSPGDMLTSPYLEVVADWKDTRGLQDFWIRFFTAHTFISKIQAGHNVRKVGLINSIIKRMFGIKNNIVDYGWIPSSLDKSALTTIVAYDKYIYNPVIKKTLKDLSPYNKLYLIPPWNLRGTIEYNMEHISGSRRRLRNIKASIEEAEAEAGKISCGPTTGCSVDEKCCSEKETK